MITLYQLMQQNLCFDAEKIAEIANLSIKDEEVLLMIRTRKNPWT